MPLLPPELMSTPSNIGTNDAFTARALRSGRNVAVLPVKDQRKARDGKDHVFLVNHFFKNQVRLIETRVNVARARVIADARQNGTAL